MGEHKINLSVLQCGCPSKAPFFSNSSDRKETNRAQYHHLSIIMRVGGKYVHHTRIIARTAGEASDVVLWCVCSFVCYALIDDAININT